MNIRDTSTNNWQKNPYWQYAEVKRAGMHWNYVPTLAIF